VKDKNIEVEWKAFELRPEGVTAPPMSEEYLAQAKAGVQSLSQQYGMQMNWNDKSKHSRRALEGAKFAKIFGLENEYHEAVFKAQFQELKNIDDMDTLIEVANQVGLNEGEFRNALNNRRYQNEVLKDHQEAQSLGITGIPCFVSGDKGVMGVQSYESLVKLMDQQKNWTV
jgi:predicted DsbA family dithiol-disulfide isomerase